MADPFATVGYESLREQTRALCAGFPGSYWQAVDSAQRYPTEFVQALTDAGLLAILIPETYGGGGQTLSAAAAVLEEIQRSGGNGNAGHAQMYTMGTLLRHGSEAQKQAYLPEIAAGRLRLQAFAVTEEDSGTDTTSIQASARRVGDHYIVSGRKVWISRAEHSDLMLLLVRTTPRDEVAKHTDGLTVLLVDLRTARGNGLTLTPMPAMINQSAVAVDLDELMVPVANRIGEEGRGFRYILSGMNAERMLVAAEAVGDAKFFLSRASEHATTRTVFGRPIGQNQGIQFPIARAYAQMRGAELLMRDAIARHEGDQPCAAEANIAKLMAADASWAAADACMQTFGGNGFAREYDIERKFRETRVFQMAPVSPNMILSYLAEHVLGLPRSY